MYIFEINEAIIKMIIKVRSSNLRYTFRTQRDELDYFFDRINLDSKIQIRYDYSMDQLGIIFSKEHCTRDE